MVICLTSKRGIRYYLDNSDLESEEGREFWRHLMGLGSDANLTDARPTFDDDLDQR